MTKKKEKLLEELEVLKKEASEVSGTHAMFMLRAVLEPTEENVNKAKEIDQKFSEINSHICKASLLLSVNEN